jgi:uncharacterized phiE125 gp8 family phage protein
MAIPVTIADARRQLQLDENDTSHDAEIGGFIADAAAWVEKYTGHILVARDVTETVRVPGRVIDLRAWPIKASATLTVLDSALSPFPGVRLDVSSRPARLSPPVGTFWPLSRTDKHLTVTVRAGYEAADQVPGNFRRAMLVLIAAYDADREGGDILAKAEAAATRMCSGFRWRRL